MKFSKINRLDKPYFSCQDISRAFGISSGSARVAAARMVKAGEIIRLKRNHYILSQRWNSASLEDRFALANLLQVPSYISLLTALSYYEVTTQVQPGFIESVGLHRTKLIDVQGNAFNYSKINKKLYFGFVRLKGFFIADPEKAFLDAIYLKSLKKYNFDLTSLDLGKLDLDKIKRLSAQYPPLTRGLLKKYGITASA